MFLMHISDVQLSCPLSPQPGAQTSLGIPGIYLSGKDFLFCVWPSQGHRNSVITDF